MKYSGMRSEEFTPAGVNCSALSEYKALGGASAQDKQLNIHAFSISARL
jgi:hypothetical protein